MKSSGKSVRPDAYKGEEDCWLEAAPAIHASISHLAYPVLSLAKGQHERH